MCEQGFRGRVEFWISPISYGMMTRSSTLVSIIIEVKS
jgi:hypothetical protein